MIYIDKQDITSEILISTINGIISVDPNKFESGFYINKNIQTPKVISYLIRKAYIPGRRLIY